ncbi:MAG: hypothetical protein AAGA42_03920 [Actinomycetota bacterium]
MVRRVRSRLLGAATVVGVALSLTACNGSDGGDPALWLLGDEQVTSQTRQFEALVSRVGCSGGVTGEVLEPRVSLSDDKITVRIDVVPLEVSASQRCPGNDPVPVMVDLGEPIGDRRLIDGGCSDGAASALRACAQDGTRWEPPPVPPQCEVPDPPLSEFDTDAIPVASTGTGAEGRDEFGETVVAVLEPMIIGGDAGQVVPALRSFGWFVRVDDPNFSPEATATPGLLWNRLVVTTCDHRIVTVAFD